MRSQFGPAVNRKPAKNSGMKPSTIAAPCVSDGGTAYTSPSAPVARSTCTSSHHALAAINTHIARKNASRCGARNRLAHCHGPVTGGGLTEGLGAAGAAEPIGMLRGGVLAGAGGGAVMACVVPASGSAPH